MLHKCAYPARGVACMQAMEPFFSVLLSSLFLGDTPTLPVIASLIPVVGGVALASTSEVTFNWPGFLAAMGSNVTFQSRNVFSKKFMAKAKVGVPCSALSPNPALHVPRQAPATSALQSRVMSTCATGFCLGTAVQYHPHCSKVYPLILLTQVVRLAA